MEHVDVARNPESGDILSGTGRQQPQQQREFTEIEHPHQFSLISQPVSELTLTQAYVGVGQPTGATVDSVSENFRISGNGV